MNRTQIYLTEAQAAALDARAKALGRTRSDLIREAVDAWLDKPMPKTGAALLAALEKIGPLKLEGFEESRKAMWRDYEAALTAKVSTTPARRKRR